MTQEGRYEVLLKWGPKRRSMQWDIRGAVLMASIFCFFYSCAEACLLPFLTLYLRHLGLDASMVGVVMGTKHLVSVMWGPASAFLARRFDQRRVVVTASLLCSAAACLVILLIPAASEEQSSPLCNDTDFQPVGGAMASHDLGDFQPISVTPTLSSITNLSLAYDNTSSYTVVHSSTVSAPQSMGAAYWPSLPSHKEPSLEERTEEAVSGDRKPKTKVLSDQNVSHALHSGRGARSAEEGNQRGGDHEFLGGLKAMDAQHQLFFLVLMAVGLWVTLAAPLDHTASDGLFEYLDFVDATDRYRAAQAWSMLGGAFGACGAGLLVSSLLCLVSNSRTIHFFGYALFAGLTLPIILLLPMYRSKKLEVAGKALKAMQLVRGNPRALLCAGTVILAGAASSIVSDFLFWQMQNWGSSELHMGIALSLALLSQFIFGLLSGQIPHLLTPTRVLCLTVVCLVLQCLYYSLLWGPWAVLPVQPLIGLGTGALWWAVHELSEDIATPGTERHVHGLFRVTSLGLGAGLGSFSGGFVVQRFGLVVLFRGAAVVLVIWALVLPILLCRTPHQRRINYSQLLTADTSEASDSESDQDRDWLVNAMEEDKTSSNR